MKVKSQNKKEDEFEQKQEEQKQEEQKQNENLEATQKSIQEDKVPEINIPGATKLDIDFEISNVVFFKVNKPLGEAAYNLIESRVDAINQKYSDKITIILVPFSVNVEQE